MAKYILKQAAIFALINEANTHSNPIKRAYTRAAAIIEQITAEDVQPVKRGKWIYSETPEFGNPYGSYICSECNHRVAYKENYCPNCGARMDGDKANNVRNLTDEENEIYESWIDHEAKDTGVNIMDGDT